MEHKKLSKNEVIEQFTTLTDALSIAYMDARMAGEDDAGFCGFLDFFQIYSGSTLKREYSEYTQKHEGQKQTVDLKGIYFLPEGQIGPQISDKEFIQKMKNDDRDGIAIIEETIYLYLTKILLHIENFSDTRQFYHYLDCYTSLQVMICHGVIISYIKQMERALTVKGIEPEKVLGRKTLEMEIPQNWEEELDLASGF